MNQIWTLARYLKWNHFHWSCVCGMCVAWNWMCIMCDQTMIWQYSIRQFIWFSSSYDFHLNDNLVKWHIMQCAHVVVVLVHFAKKKIQFLQKAFEMQTNDLQSLVCILFEWRLRTLQVSLISSAAAIWATETWIIGLSSVRNQDSVDKAQSELAPTGARYRMDDVWTRNTFFGVGLLSHSWPLEF